MYILYLKIFRTLESIVRMINAYEMHELWLYVKTSPKRNRFGVKWLKYVF